MDQGTLTEYMYCPDDRYWHDQLHSLRASLHNGLLLSPLNCLPIGPTFSALRTISTLRNVCEGGLTVVPGGAGPGADPDSCCASRTKSYSAAKMS
jgi:hypothetical protein